MEGAAKALLARNIEQRKDYLEKYNALISETEQKKRIQIMLCPRCGNELVKRKGQYGEFYGCSSYPKCRYTEKINR